MLWAMLAVAYAVRPLQRLRPWVFILLLPCLLAWTYLYSRERASLQELELRDRSAEIRARGRRASAAVRPLAERAEEAARTTFAELDADADGGLTVEELGSRPQPLLFDRAGRDLDRLEPAIAAYHFRDCDLDQDGRVTEAEWTCKVDSVSRQNRLMGLPLHRERAFAIVDGDRDGRIGLDELLGAPRACRPYLDEDTRSLLDRRDADGDGHLSAVEWAGDVSY